VLLAVLTVVWGGNWPAMKVAVREIDPWTFRTVCLLLGGGALLGLVRAGGQRLRVPPAERASLALVAVFNITVWHILSAYALTLVQAGRAVIVGYTMPLWTVLFGRLLLGERLTRGRGLALGLGLAGMVVLVAPEIHALRAAPGGVLLMLGAAVSWAIGTVLTKAAPWTIPTAVLTGWQLVLGAAPIATGGLVRVAAGAEPGPVDALLDASPGALAGLAYATFVGVTFCHWAWFRVVSVLPAAVAAIGTLGVPIVGVFSSVLVLGEAVGPAEVAALLLVVAGLGALVASRVRGESGAPAPPVSSGERGPR
jgi:drug/metabolite transporter (DMT)-like permease